MATETALELDTEAAGYTKLEAVHFGGFPGVWEPGRPVAVSELGFDTEEQALALVAELELPLTEVQVDLGTAPMPVATNHLLSEEQQRALEVQVDETVAKKRWTHAELDEAAAAANLTWPDDTTTVTAKLAFLEAARDGDVSADGEQTGDTDGNGES